MGTSQTRHPELTWGTTPGGKLYGTVLNMFSGAYTGTLAEGFVIDRGWTVVRGAYRAIDHAGERILFVPLEPSPDLSPRSALVYERGETVPIGIADAAELRPDGSVSGWFRADASGRPLRGSFGDLGEAYRRYFVWRGGVRTLRGFRQTSVDGSTLVGGRLPEPKGPRVSRFPFPARPSFATYPREDPRLARAEPAGPGRYRLEIGGRRESRTFAAISAPQGMEVARSRKRFLYGSLRVPRSPTRTETMAFLQKGTGTRLYPDRQAVMERDGRVLLNRIDPYDPENGRPSESSVYTLVQIGRERTIGRAYRAEILRDGSVVGTEFVYADGRPIVGSGHEQNRKVFQRSFRWRDGVRTAGALRPLR